MFNTNECDLVIFDGTAIYRCIVFDQAYPTKHGEWELIDGVQDLLHSIPWRTPGLSACITAHHPDPNWQMGGDFTARDKAQSSRHSLMSDILFYATGFRTHERLVHVCPHLVSDGCGCMKIGPSVLDWFCWYARAKRKRTTFVGSTEEDKNTAEKEQLNFMWAWEFFGKSKEEWVWWLAQRAEEDRRRAFEQRIIDPGA